MTDVMEVVHSQPGSNICSALARVLTRNNRIRQHTKLWYTTRTRMITASDIASVVGLNPYNSQKQVFKKKTGQSKPFKGNFATRRGNRLEAVALAAYEKKSGNVAWHEDLGLMQHKDYPVIGGSPDGITLDGILIEIKCPLTRKIIPGTVPGYYGPQMQILMEIFDLETAHFVQFKPATKVVAEVLDITVVKRDRALFAAWLPILLDFMESVFEFYKQVNLPVGTPMIDWEAEDRVAFDKLAKEQAIGIGKVCAFVDDVFVVEEYTGVGNPVIRTEHTLSDAAMASAQAMPQAQETIALLVSDSEDSSAFVDRIIEALPSHLRGDKRKREEEDEDDKEFIDIEAIQARINAARRPLLHP